MRERDEHEIVRDELAIRSQIDRIVYWAVRDELVCDGADPIAASRRATRAARAAVLRARGYEQGQISGQLRVSKRTADGDMARWKRALLSPPADLPPVPKPPDVVVITESPARMRAAA